MAAFRATAKLMTFTVKVTARAVGQKKCIAAIESPNQGKICLLLPSEEEVLCRTRLGYAALCTGKFCDTIVFR